MNLKKQLATENTEFTEKDQLLNTAKIGITHHTKRNPLPLCAICDLCGLNWGLG